ncbi:MAG: addiction module protein [Propionicimonas sp.]|uniref:addiction module protein n=1 Tax=Propionicimonas sp. TaxID=1955623 RepID=UPI003D0DDF3C
MAQEVVDVERALLALPPHDRAAVVHAALISLDGGASDDSQDDIDTAWREEVAGRLADALEGGAELGSFEATRARFAAKYPAAAQ